MWHDDFNQRSLENPVVNDAHDYGIRITPAVVPSGEVYWRIIGVHHLTGEENRGGHHLYFEALNSEGVRVKSFAGWTWEGRQLGERADPVILDKPLIEPAGNIGLGAPQTVTAWMIGTHPEDVPFSDSIHEVHIRHADEEEGNTWGHHSFYVVFQQTMGTPEPTPVKLFDHYVLLNLDWLKYVIVAHWLATAKVTAGFKVEEAKLAEHVTMIGHFSQNDKDALIEAGCALTELDSSCGLLEEISLLGGESAR